MALAMHNGYDCARFVQQVPWPSVPMSNMCCVPDLSQTPRLPLQRDWSLSNSSSGTPKHKSPVRLRHKAPNMHWSQQQRVVRASPTMPSQHGSFHNHDALGFSTTKGTPAFMQALAIVAAALAQALPARTLGQRRSSRSAHSSP